MKKINKSPLILLAIGVLVIGLSSVGAARAAMIAQQDENDLDFRTATFDIDFTGDVADGEIVFPAMAEDENVKIGKMYDEAISVQNTSGGEYEEFIRVVVKKSWLKDGKKSLALNPEMIEIQVAPDWYINKAESTAEQDVYYLKEPVKQGTEKPFITGIKINDGVTKVVENTGTETTIVNTYSYNGASIKLSLQADAVQTNNGKDAIRAAWGIGESFTGVDNEGKETSVNFVISDK